MSLLGIAKMGLSLFTGGGKKPEDGIALANRAADGIDKMFFTKEEQEDAKVERIKLKFQAAELGQKFVEMTNNENSARSKTRRRIACSIIILDIVLTGFYVYVCTFAVIWTAKNEQLVWLADRIKDVLLYWGTATTLIITFYFGYYAVSNVVGKFTNKKTPSVPDK